MTAGRLTRRSLLAAAGGAVASAGLTRPARVLGALAGSAAPSLADRWLGTVVAGQRTIELARNADLASLEKIGAGDTDPGFVEELAELEVPPEEPSGE